MKIMIRGAGDLATGIASRLYGAGHQILMTEIREPLTVRRDAESALVYLTAAHCLYEEDPERSEYFMDMYRESVALASRAAAGFSGGLERASV